MINKVFKNIALVILSVFLIVYLTVQLKNIFIASIETETTVYDTFEDTVEMKCYIIRDETLVSNNSGGMYYYVVSDGDKLSKNQTIAEIFATDSEYRIKEEVKSIDARLHTLEKSAVKHNYFTLNVSNIDKDISSIISDLRSSAVAGDLGVAVQAKNELLITLNKRFLVVNAREEFDAAYKELGLRKSMLESSVSKSVGGVYAPIPGFFYSDVDGYEGVLNVDLIERGDYNEIMTALEAEPVATQNVVGKIVPDFDWYTLCITDKNTAQRFKTNSSYELSYPYSVGETLKSRLVQKIVDPDSESVIMVFKSISHIDSFNYMRSQVVQVNLASYSGLRIKKEALRILDGHEGVYVLSGNIVKFKRAYKKYENDGYYIITTNDPYSEERAAYVDYENALKKNRDDPDNNPMPTEVVEYIDAYLEVHDSVIVFGKDLYRGRIAG